MSAPPPDTVLRIMMAGASGAGKTSLIYSFVDNSFNPNNISTIGVDFRVKSLHLQSGQRAKVQIWDTAGQDRYRFIPGAYWRGADGIVFVYEVTDLNSYSAIELWAADAAKHNSTHRKILVANKADLGFRRVVSREMGEKLARDLGMEYLEVSAKTGLNVSESFRGIIELAAANKAVVEQRKQQLRLEAAAAVKEEVKKPWRFCGIL